MNDTPRETCETCYGLGRVDAVYAPCPDCELTAARAEIERLDTAGIHSCHKNCQRPNCVLRRELRAVTEQRDVASQCHKWCYEDRKRIIEELTAVTEQRDRLAEALEHTMKHMRHSLNCPPRLTEGLHACNCQMEWSYDNATEALQSLNQPKQ